MSKVSDSHGIRAEVAVSSLILGLELGSCGIKIYAILSELFIHPLFYTNDFEGI